MCLPGGWNTHLHQISRSVLCALHLVFVSFSEFFFFVDVTLVTYPSMF